MNMTHVESSNTKEQLGKALGRLASGVYIATLSDKGQQHGVMATWISQAAFEPPSITVAFNKQRHFLTMLKEGSIFTVNVLSKQNMDIFKAFAKPAQAAEDDRFSGLALVENNDGGPIFASAVSYLNCRVKSFMDSGDHSIALAEVVSGNILNADGEPMVHLRNNGFQY